MTTQTITTDTLIAGDVIHDNKGWFYRVRADGQYDSFSEWTAEGDSPIVSGDSVLWPVALMVRDGKGANGAPGNGQAMRVALFLSTRR